MVYLKEVAVVTTAYVTIHEIFLENSFLTILEAMEMFDLEERATRAKA